MSHKTPLTRFHYDHVSSHINQTMLVDYLLTQGIVSYDDIANLYDSTTDQYREVFQWLAFSNFWQADYDCLKAQNIPVLNTEYGVWVGITSFGSHYHLYVYPELINALFNPDITYEDILQL